MSNKRIAIFTSVDHFNTWVSNVNSLLGYPITGTNALNGENNSDFPTQNFATLIYGESSNKLIAYVDYSNPNLFDGVTVKTISEAVAAGDFEDLEWP